MKSTIQLTNEQRAICEELFGQIKPSRREFPVAWQWTTWDKREKQITTGLNDWKWTWEILPLFIVDKRYLCALDCGFGYDIVVDLSKKKFFWARQGIFQPDWCFLSDYYGFHEGAFFYKHKP